jgi:probable HAF family extracellular repeat protein
MKSTGFIVKLLVIFAVLVAVSGSSKNPIVQLSYASASEYCPIFPPDPPTGPAYTVVDLGTLGGTYSHAYDINNFGQIVGDSTTSGGVGHAFLWENNSMTDLGTLASGSIAFAVSDGEVIAGASGQAVRWFGTPGSIDGLGYLTGGGTSAAEGVYAGRIVGSSDTTNVIPFGYRAFQYMGGTMTDLGTLPGGTWSFAHDVSFYGVVGNSTAPVGGGTNGPRATLWDGGPQDLGVLASQAPPHRFSLAQAINNRGEIVGDSWEDLTGVFKEPFLWKGGIMTELLPGFDATCPYGNAFDINNFGQAVGIAGSTSFRKPVMWQDGKIYFLQYQLVNPGDWDLKEAWAINDSGMIVGFGTTGGETHAFLLLPAVTTELTAEHLEVTQAIQDLNNSVRLVADKRTYVRFYVSAVGKGVWTYARLKVEKGGMTRYLSPINPGEHIIVKTDILNRFTLNDSFLFELPTGFRDGAVTLTAEVNPKVSWRDRTPQELNYADNTITRSVTFESVPPLDLVVYGVGYKTTTSGEYIFPSFGENSMLSFWLQRAYPISKLNVTYNNLWVPKPVTPGTNYGCRDVNQLLLKVRSQLGDTSSTRYYGMVSDKGGFMVGCSNGIRGLVASGPTGDPASSTKFNWDTDFTYGDWYGGHELAHALGRHHAEFCGAIANNNGIYPPGYVAYPYAYGSISPATHGLTALVGFDIQSPHKIYAPGWTDIMTYCKNQWISDFNYEGLMDFIQANFPLVTTPQIPMDRLLVLGTIDSTGQVDLQPLFVIPDAEDVEPNVPGPYALVLRDGSGDELARYPFTPDQLAEEDSEEIILGISELVPHVSGMEQLDVEGPGGDLLMSVTAGATPPTVTLIEANMDEILSPGAVSVTWTASDPDSDPLTFALEYSPDNGSTWKTILPYWVDTTAVISDTSLIAGDQALFRVWATDGIHTTNDTTDFPFTVPNHPPTAEILEPSSWMTITVSQTLGLVGQAYDVDVGTMDDSQLTWLSNLDGTLGNGAQLSVSGLITGVHTITFQADDGTDIITDTVQVTVVSDPTQLPYAENALLAAPEPLIFYSAGNVVTQTLSIANQNIFHTLAWDAVDEQTWLSLSVITGTTPGDLVVSFDPTDLPEGEYQGTITLTSPELPGFSLVIPVQVYLTPYQIYLPAILR